jgi:ferric-dicitrate binding protein FerR (iron transport regulator)
MNERSNFARDVGINRKVIMNNALFEELLALRLKRPLTPQEQANLENWLAVHPTDRTRWAEECALSSALRRLPTLPAPSNFMARVWQDIETQERRAATASTASGWRAWLRWPSLAQQFALAAILLTVVVIVQSRRVRTQSQVARSIEQIAAIARGPDVELLKDFEAISRLHQSAADVELLAAFERER